MSNNSTLKSSIDGVWLKRGLATIILVGFTWLIISAVVNNNEEDLNPQVVRAPLIIKERPEQPGGMQINHQDKQLFDLLENTNSEAKVKDSIMEESKTIDQRNKDLVTKAVNKKTEQELLKAKHLKDMAKAKQQASAKVEKAVVVKKVEAIAEKSVEAVVKKVAEVKEKVSTSVITGWALQLGSFRQNSDAKKAITIYTKKVGNILQGFNPYVKKVDLGEKGVVYRVYFTGFKDGQQAKETCQQLKVKKQGCFRTNLK